MGNYPGGMVGTSNIPAFNRENVDYVAKAAGVPGPIYTESELDNLAYKVKAALDATFGQDSNDSPFDATDLNLLMEGYLKGIGWMEVPRG